MGAEARCTAAFGRTRADGKALLETDELIFRAGALRLSIPYKTMSSVESKNGALRVMSPQGTLVLQLGDLASRWAEKIRHPPARIDKLGIKRGQRVVIVGVRDGSLGAEIEAVGAAVSSRLTGGSDVIFIGAEHRDDLQGLQTAKSHLQPNGAIWVIRPKGSKAISEGDVMTAGRQNGLVDVKVARFSETHTAQKFVIPKKER